MQFAPPNPPWQQFNHPNSGGYLSVYYSDDLSPLPVRFVTKPGDNKSDPNFETLTYGLFSTCSPSMRSGIVQRKFTYVFFTTHRPDGRVLSGFYHIKWYAPAHSPRKNDFYLAADEAHFVSEAPLLSTVDRVCRTHINRRFRNMLLLEPRECNALRTFLLGFPNALEAYRKEIDRLERFNLRHTGFRYPSWSRPAGFDWASAEYHLSPANQDSHSPVVNASPSGNWKCSHCSAVVHNKALLRQCPGCSALGTLSPH